MLLAAGAGLNEKGIEGLTPLHVAAISGRRVFYKWLLEAGADREARDMRQRKAGDVVKGS